MDIDTRTALGNTLNALVSAPFSKAFPLPFRVILLGGAGIFSWATNLHLLSLLGVDAPYVLDFRNADRPNTLPSRQSHGQARYSAFVQPGALFKPIYRIAGAYTMWAFAGWFMFRIASFRDTSAIDHYKFIPTITLLGIAFAAFMPLNAVERRERRAFCHCLKRCLISSMWQPVPFAEVLMADILTSFAKVIGDLWISTFMLLPSGSLEALPVFTGYWAWVVPAMMSFPYLIRFRQCIADYAGSNAQNRLQLWNAIKYATAFPVIFLSAMQIPTAEEATTTAAASAASSNWFIDNRLWGLWLFAVAVNSIYSFWWDVTQDWGLSLLVPTTTHVSLYSSPLASPRGHSPHPSSGNDGLPRSGSPFQAQNGRPEQVTGSHDSSKKSTTPYGLRSTLLFPDTVMYYLAIMLNLVLRFTWSLKLSSHLHSIAELEHGVFIMEALELLRRWVWVFFRIEHEAIKRGVSHPHRRNVVELDNVPPSRFRSHSPLADDGQ